MSSPSTLPHKPADSPATASNVRADTSPHPPPPPPVNSYDLTTITRDTDQFGTTLFINIPGYGRFTPDQLIACLEAQEALGAARADAAALEVEVERLSAERKTMQRAYDALREALEAEHNRALVAEEQCAIWRLRAHTAPAGTPEDVFEYALQAQHSYRFAVAFSLVKETQRRLLLQLVAINTLVALQAFVEAKRIAGIDRDGWYIENFSIEAIT